MSSGSRSNPLTPVTYLVRNAGRSLPLVGVIVLAVLLIAGIVAMMNSIPLSIRTIYDYSKFSLGITPRGDAALTPELRAKLEKGSPVPLERVIVCRASPAIVKSIVGKWPFVVLAMSQEDLRYYVRKMGVREIMGRYPEAGKPEALISEPVARNLNLKLGSNLLDPNNSDAYSPLPVKIVGIAQSEEWMMLGTVEYHREHHFPPVDVLLATAKNLEDQAKLDTWALRAFKGRRAQVFAYQQLEKDTEEMFGTLYKILNVVLGTLTLVITVMMGMMINIHLGQRVQEFGLLQALGYTKDAILRRVLSETVLVVMGGWIIGVLVAFGLLHVVKAILMDPSAYALDPLDPRALRYTIPVPIAILIAAGFTFYLRFKKFDPVGVVERRLV